MRTESSEPPADAGVVWRLAPPESLTAQTDAGRLPTT
jgi:hypothetical protein